MSCDQRYPYPQVFLVDGGGRPQDQAQPPNLVPCWSFPPSQERVRSGRKSQGFMGVSCPLAMIVLLLFLLVFAALGFEAYQIQTMKSELEQMRPVTPEKEFSTAEKQIGEWHGEDKDNRPAAHLIGRAEKKVFRETLRWEPKAGQAFVSGAVAYRVEDGGLQVNKSGLYYIYSRVELIFKNCEPTSSFVHTVFVRRRGHPTPLRLMEAHRAGFCSQWPKHSWTSESYLGSALKLQELDRVFVNVSHPAFISQAHYGNFFGLYEI